MYKHRTILENQMFQKELTIPVNTTATATTAMRTGRSQGALAITIVAADANVALAAGKSFTLGFTESDTEGGTYAAPKTDVSVKVTHASALANVRIGTVLASLILPEDCGNWVKAIVGTDDAAAVGKANVIVDYLAR